MMLIVGAGAVGTILAAYATRAAKMPLRLYVRDIDLDAVQGVDAHRLGRVESKPRDHVGIRNLDTHPAARCLRYHLPRCRKRPHGRGAG